MNNEGSPYRDFLHMSAEQAATYTDHIVSVQEVRLSDLAFTVAGTGGPIERLDGSFESLKVLWPWYIGYALADFPGLENDRLPAMTVRRHPHTPSDLGAELIEAYVFEVLARISPGARRAAYRGTDYDGDNGRTVVYLRSAMRLHLDTLAGSLSYVDRS